jgi:hypothetical protein
MRYRAFLRWAPLLLALAVAGRAHADIAPPDQPPGNTIGPSGATQVQMRAERVVLTVRPDTAESPELGNSGVVADVRAEFFMHNAGQADEQLQVRFPLADPNFAGGSFGQFPQVQGFAASVNDAPAQVGRLELPNPRGAGEPPVAWATFDATFPAGADTAIVATYAITATGYAPEARFAYVLETGAGWRDAIGTAEIVLRLPYEASAENVFLDQQTTAGATLAGNEVRWRFANLEPTDKDNIFVTILSPAAWGPILAARERVAAAPQDADAAADLARAYAAAITSRFPIDERDPFEERMEQAYEQALTLAPPSADLRVEYAKQLLNGLAVQAQRTTDDPYVQRIAAQLAAALATDPQHEGALQLLEELRSAVDGALELPTVVAQAAATITATSPIAAPTPAPSETPAPAPTDPPTSAPQPEPSSALTTEASPTATRAEQPSPPQSGSGLPAMLIVALIAAAALVAGLGVGLGILLGRRRR